MRRISPSLIVSIVALAVTVSGVAYASSYIITSTKQIKPSVRRALKGNRGPRGYTGSQGPQGAQGPQGPAGVSDLGQITVVDSAPVYYNGNTVESAVAYCPGGFRAIAGGGASISTEQLAASVPTGDRGGWGVIGVDTSGAADAYIQATAVCAPTGKAVAAGVRSHRDARIDRLVKQLRAKR